MLLAALCTLPALANDGPTPRFFAEANGSAVDLRIELQTAGEPGIGEELDLVRIEGETETAIESAVRREVADADYETEYCKNWEVDSTWGDDTGERWTCDEHPDRCEDCDGDGTNECQWGCVTWQGYNVQDGCVSAGEVAYEVRETGHDWRVTGASVTVADVGQDCDDGTEVGDTGPDGGDDDDGLFSCATAPAPHAGRLLLGLVMGLVGWLAFRRD